MSPIEDLLRQTFADRAQDVTEPPLLPATQRRRTRWTLVVAGAAAAAAVLVGSTVALHGAGSRAAAPKQPTPAFTPTKITTTDGRTSAVLDWVPAWTPTTASGYEVTPYLQARFYGFYDGEFAAIAIGKGDCTALRKFSGLAVNLKWDQAVANILPDYCRPLPGGGSLGIVMGGVSHAEAAMQRMADSVRFGRRDEIALPIGFGDGTAANRMSVGAVYEARSRWEGNVTGSDGTDLYAEPSMGGLQGKQTVGGRPADVVSHGNPTTVWIMLSPTVLSGTSASHRDRAVAVAAGLHLGAVPDYPWVH